MGPGESGGTFVLFLWDGGWGTWDVLSALPLAHRKSAGEVGLRVSVRGLAGGNEVDFDPMVKGGGDSV